jgi:hypothetical protein
MTTKKDLDRHLRSWKAKLQAVLPAKEVWFPDRFATTAVPDGFNYRLQEPICFGALPIGGGRSAKMNRIWAFIEGEFDTRLVAGVESLHSFGASVVFFEAKPRIRRFKLADAFHFDFHVPETAASSPHPLFHVQRNVRWDEARWKLALEKMTFAEIQTYRFPEFHPGVKRSSFRLSRFRLPSARLDLFAIMLAMVADMVIKHDVEEHCETFDSLIDLTQSNDNPLHQLTCQAAALPACFPGSNSSAGIWYPTFRSFTKGGVAQA